MEYFGKALEIFLNNHLMPTMVSYVIMVIINLAIPNDYWMVDKLGINMFRVFAFALSFVFIEFLIGLMKKIKEICKSSKIGKEKEVFEEKQQNKQIEELRSEFDSLPSIERTLILKLVKTKNKPVYNCDVGYIDVSLLDLKLYNLSQLNNYVHMIKLTNNYFEEFSYIYKTYGMLGHFNDETDE